MSDTLVAGLGVTGVATARALHKLGYQVTVFEERDDAAHRELAQELAALGITVTFAIPDDFPKQVITSPGWRPDHPVLQKATDKGAHIISEVEFAYLHYLKEFKAGKTRKRHWIGITGTNGKTTTVGMTEAIFTSAGLQAIACGNVGTPVIEIITGDVFYEYLIVELSSFQLHWSSA